MCTVKVFLGHSCITETNVKVSTNLMSFVQIRMSLLQALQQLEQDIGDVNQIFADLARIVHDQGDMVDSIEANVEHAQIHVEQVCLFQMYSVILTFTASIKISLCSSWFFCQDITMIMFHLTDLSCFS